MICLGVDEAGLGPFLGPLATASASWRMAWPSDAEAPDPAAPWRLLSGVVARDSRRGERRLAVGDSKEVYAAGGLAALERTVRAFAQAASPSKPGRETGEAPADDWIRALDLRQDPPTPPPWHESIDHAWTRRPDAESRGGGAGEDETPAPCALRAALADCGMEALDLHARLVHPEAFNRRVALGLNKNEVLLSETGAHVQRAIARCPGGNLFAVVDKQGGRDRYAPVLSAWFGGAWVETLGEGRKASDYRLELPSAGGGPPTRLRVVFAAKADSRAFGTALASQTAKYARERFMASLNAWFAERLPGLRPTAGYPLDARRFLADLAPVWREEWRGRLVRCR